MKIVFVVFVSCSTMHPFKNILFEDNNFSSIIYELKYESIMHRLILKLQYESIMQLASYSHNIINDLINEC